MAVLDFPASPLAGDKYPVPAVVGQPQYTYDGTKWTTIGPQITNAAPATALPLMNADPALVGVTTKYAREDHVHPSDTSKAGLTQAVRYDAVQAPTAAQQVQARQNVFAAPFDAMAYSGIQINGGMEISQERGFGNTINASGYVCDGWTFAKAGSMVANAAVYTNQSSVPPPGFVSSLVIGVGTAAPTLAAGDYTLIGQAIEGRRIGRLWWGASGYAQPITISFWTAHHRTGLYTGTVRNAAADQTYAFSYTQNVADVFEYKTVTIPGANAGTWGSDSGGGMFLTFAMACGTTYIAPSLNTWVAGSFFAGPGQVNGVGTTADGFRIAGVVVLPGIEAPSAARSPYIMRPYDQELVTCQRYYEKTYDMVSPVGSGFMQSGVVQQRALIGNDSISQDMWVPFKQRKRIGPTLTIWSPGTANTPGKVRNQENGGEFPASPQQVSEVSFIITLNAVAVAAGQRWAFHYTADARL